MIDTRECVHGVMSKVKQTRSLQLKTDDVGLAVSSFHCFQEKKWVGLGLGVLNHGAMDGGGVSTGQGLIIQATWGQGL